MIWQRNILYKEEMVLRLSPLMIVIGRFEMDMKNLIGPRYGARSKARIDTTS